MDQDTKKVKTNEDIIAEALEQAWCSKINLQNLVTQVPQLADHPMIKVVDLQIQMTIDILKPVSPEVVSQEG